jgi:DNA-binding IclR family transcriptional regulator
MIAAPKTDSQPVENNLKALTHGLDALRVLSEAKGPMTATEIARKIGLHQSSASRILKTLMSAGYVRKPDYHSFTIDYGVVALGGTGIGHFPLVRRPREVVERLAEKFKGLTVSLATLWQGQIIYFLHGHHGQEIVRLSAGGFPLHLSSLAMRALLDLPEEEALEILADSRRRYGWDCPTDNVPDTERALLAKARTFLNHDCLILEDWQRVGQFTAAIPIDVENHPRAALALSGLSSLIARNEIALHLTEGRRLVEASLRQA